MSRIHNAIAAFDAPSGDLRYGAVVGLGVALLTAAVNIRSISNDNVPNVLLPVSILRDADLELGEFIARTDRPARTRRYWAVETDRGIYSRYPIWTAVAALPVLSPVVLAVQAAGADHLLAEERFLLGLGRFAALGFTAVIAGALAVALRRFLGGAEAALLALLALLGTTLWHSAASQLSNQTLPVACIAVSLALVTREDMRRRRALALGLLGGLAVAARLPAVFAAIAPLGVFLSLRSWRRFIPAVCAGLAVFPVLTLIYNAHAFGHPLATGYSAESQDRFSAAFIDGALGLVFSPTCGLFVHSPLLAVGLIATIAALAARRSDNSATRNEPLSPPRLAAGPMLVELQTQLHERSQALAHAHRLMPWLLLGFVGQWLLFAKWWAWNGGLIFGGPRMLSETIPGLVLLVALTAGRSGRPAIPCGLPKGGLRGTTLHPSRGGRGGLRAVVMLGCFSIGLFLLGTSAYDAVAPSNPAKPDWDASSDILSIYISRFGPTNLLLAVLRNAGILLITLLVACHFAGRILAPEYAGRRRAADPTPLPTDN